MDDSRTRARSPRHAARSTLPAGVSTADPVPETDRLGRTTPVPLTKLDADGEVEFLERLIRKLRTM